MNHLITGGDGYVGRYSARSILQNNENKVTLFIRVSDSDELDLKTQKIKDFFTEDEFSRIKIIGGDISQAQTLETIDKSTITHILHTAAVIRFNVEEDVANNININGTKVILEFAKQCPQLQKFTYVSTVYATGNHQGSIEEKPYLDAQFINHYERSKNQCEKLIIQEYGDLPWDIVRIATVIAHDETGFVEQYNVFHNTLRLLYNGLISILPGQEQTPVYLITGQFAGNSVAYIHQQKASSKIFHACHQKEESATLKQIIDWVFEVFDQDEVFSKKKILKPLFADENAFNLLSSNLEALSTGILSDALGSITPFAQQLYITKDFQNSIFRESIDQYQAPNIENLIKETTAYLISTKWGRKTK